LDGKMHNQIDHILIDRRQHLKYTGCLIVDGNLVVAKFKERLAVSKQTTHVVHMKRFNLKKLKS
jgi:hypothetical protein